MDLMPSQLGTFNLTYTVPVPDHVFDHVFGGHFRNRYEHIPGESGKLEVTITISPDGDVEKLARAITAVLEGAGFRGD